MYENTTHDHDCDDADPWTPDGFECWLWSALTGPEQLSHDTSPLLVGADWFSDDADDNASRAEELSDLASTGRMAQAGTPTLVDPTAARQADSLATFLLWVAAPVVQMAGGAS